MKHLHKNMDLMRDELILCTGLPGQRSITREDCGRRYLLAGEKTGEFSRTALDLGRMSSLEVCGTFLEGGMNAKRLGEKSLDHADRKDDSEKRKKRG